MKLPIWCTLEDFLVLRLRRDLKLGSTGEANASRVEHRLICYQTCRTPRTRFRLSTLKRCLPLSVSRTNDSQVIRSSGYLAVPVCVSRTNEIEHSFRTPSRPA